MRGNCGEGGFSVGCRMRFMNYLMRSVSRVAIMLFFRNRSEGGRTAVISLDAVKVEVERGTAVTNAAVAGFVC